MTSRLKTSNLHISTQNEADDADEDADPATRARLEENAVTMTKMNDLRRQMADLNVERRRTRKSKGARR